MKKIFALILFLFSCLNSVAQLENSNWYFGDSAGVKFTTSGVVPILSSHMRMYKGGSAISDSLGNLLFYSQSQTVWNKNNDTMENGFGIKPDYTDANDLLSHNTQGTLVLPKPNHNGIYYLFSLCRGLDSTLVISIVDMNQNGGLGKVISKNQFIYLDSLSEQMTAIKHANGRDYWVICHEWLTSRFVKFLITPDSIIGPIYQVIGNYLDTSYFAGWGQSIFSPNGEKYYVSCQQGVMKLFDFDRCTGVFSNMIDLSTSPYPYLNNKTLYGCSFSPDGRKLYISSYKALIQFDLDSSNIQLTRDTIWNNPFANYIIGAHLLGIDGKIYFTNSYSIIPNNVYTNHTTHLCLIDNPNNKGSFCHVIIDTISLGGKRVFGGLPNTVNYSLDKLEGSACDTLTSIQNETLKTKNIVSIYPNPATNQLTVESVGSKQYAVNRIEISNSLGVEIYEESGNLKSKIINLKSFPSGIYFIKLYFGDGGMEVKKFVKE